MIDLVAEQIIKGIIVSNSKTGITCADIGKKYSECVGEAWPLARNERKMIEYLQSISCLNAFQSEQGELIWYIRGKTLNEQTRGQICRARQIKKSPSDRLRGKNLNNNVIHQTNYRNSNQMSGAQPQTAAPFCPSTPNNRFGRKQSDASEFENQPKTSASLYNYDLLGDNFFLHMAKIDLKCTAIKRGRLDQCGLCISGQTIAEATARISRFSDTKNMRLIINIGSFDIMNNQLMADICNDYINLVKTCRKRNIQIVITTLAPLVNLLYDESVTQKIQQFNDFLISKFGSKYPVIDITDCMKSPETNKVSFACYQPVASNVSGTKHSCVLWNRVGRQRILKHIKSLLTL